MAIGHMGCSTKLGSHLETNLHRQREETLGIANHQITRLRVKEGSIGVFLRAIRKIVLPVLVGGLTISHMTFQPQPTIGEGQHPILGQRQAHLRHRSGIDAQQLRTAAQLIVFQLHGKFLCTHRQHTMQPTHLTKRLLHHQPTGVVMGNGHIQTIAEAPVAQRVLCQGANQTPTQIAIRALQRTQSVFVGIQPERRLAIRQRGLCLQLIFQSFQQ